MALNICEARKQADQMICDRCNLSWDTNDPEPPRCGKLPPAAPPPPPMVCSKCGIPLVAFEINFYMTNLTNRPLYCVECYRKHKK